MSLETITALSVKYGSDPAYVLAGGGNTSVKDEKYLYVKPSGVALAKIKPENFVKMDRALIEKISRLRFMNSSRSGMSCTSIRLSSTG